MHDRKGKRMRLAGLMLAVLLVGGAVQAETIVLKDGTFIEGKITLQTSTSVRVDTRFGVRTFARKEIDQIVESINDSSSASGKTFAELPAVMKAVLNAQADYDLLHYEKALSRLEPYRDYAENKAIRMRIEWLTVEINERLGRWDVAKRLLKEKQEGGAPPEKTRAKAHLDLFEVNTDYDLRFVGKKHARNFIFDEDLRNRAREPGSLRDAEVMRAALEEYCEQLLVEDKLSVKAFADKLDERKTLEAVKNATGSGDLSPHLPYIEDLKKAEASLLKAQAILGDYSSAFELDLARAELNHLWVVTLNLGEEALRLSPETFTPASDRASGTLTAEGRRQWQQRCDQFLDAAKPVTRLLDYMIAKTDRYPEMLRDMRTTLIDINERLKENVRAVKKARDRTRA